MRVQDPLAVVTPTVDGDVLAVLARADSWFTVATLHQLIGSRSAEGIRRTLTRRVGEGIVLVEPAGRASLYRLNRDHLAAPAIIELSRLGDTLRERIAERISGWAEQPAYAALFGSAARCEMTAASDLDLFLLRTGEATEGWEAQVEALARDVHAWTGNDPRVLEYSVEDVRGAAVDEPVLQAISEEGIPLAGERGQFRRLTGAR